MSLHLELTPKILAQLSFEESLDEKGRPAGKTPPGTREWMVRDTGVRGLLLRLTPRTTTWYVQRKVAGMPMRRAMGHWWSADEGYRRLTLTDARKRARIWLGLMEQGLDPLVEKKKRQRAAKAERQRDGLTLQAAYVDYVEGKSRRDKPSTNIDRGKVSKWMEGAPLWTMAIHDITDDDVEATFGPLLRVVLEGKRRPKWGPKSISAGTVSKLYAYCSAAYARAAQKVGIPAGRGVGPFARWRADQPWPKAVARTTYLPTGTDEGKTWLRGLVDLQARAHDTSILDSRPDPRSRDLKPHVSVLADYFMCVLLWGTRSSETAKLQWADIDFDRGYVLFPAAITKSRRAGIVPLTPWAKEILLARKAANERWRPEDTTTWVFPSRQHGKPLSNARSVLLALKRETGLWITAHDLRRTMATDLSKAKVGVEELGRLLVVGAALNHSRGAAGSSASPVTSDYIQEHADLLRPHVEARELALRELAGLPAHGGRSNSEGDAEAVEVEALLRRMESDSALTRRVKMIVDRGIR